MPKAVLIMGMHRSGTSALAQCLMDGGLSFDIPKISDGYWPKHVEYYRINQLNEAVIKSWKHPDRSKSRLVNYGWKWRIGRFVRSNIPDANWLGIKDPRMLLTYDLWLPHFTEFKVLGIFRRPEEVAKSLSVRDEYGSTSFIAGLELWRVHNEALIRMQSKYKFPILNYNSSKQEFGDRLQMVSDAIHIPFSRNAFDERFSDDKRHHESLSIPDNCKQVYDDLVRLSELHAKS